jgi:hypothetical protein
MIASIINIPTNASKVITKFVNTTIIVTTNTGNTTNSIIVTLSFNSSYAANCELKIVCKQPSP